MIILVVDPVNCCNMTHKEEQFEALKRQVARMQKVIDERRGDEIGSRHDENRTAAEPVTPNLKGTEARNFLVQLIAKVPVKLREKIWDFNYVDFGLLIPEIEKPTEVPITFFRAPDDIFQFRQGKQTKRIHKPQVWLQAFSMYSAVLTARWPTRGP